MLKQLTVLACCIFLLTACASHKVVITSNPPGASVAIDGEEKGLTPLKVDLRHTTFGVPYIKLSKEGYETLETRMDYKASAPAIFIDILTLTPLLFFNIMCPGDGYRYDLVKTGETYTFPISSRLTKLEARQVYRSLTSSLSMPEKEEPPKTSLTNPSP